MLTRLRITLAFILVALAAMAEVPNDFRSEQILLAPQQSVCAPGDSVLVRGKILSITADGTAPYSRYAYLELISDRDTAVVRKKVACDDSGNFATYIQTQAAARKGTYILRAYTNLMRNFSPESFAHAPLLIGRDFPEPDDIYGGADARCTVAPDGGVLVAGAPQSVAAFLCSGTGHPLQGRPVALVSESGDTVAMSVTSPSGYAVFDIIPAAEETYSVRIPSGSGTRQFSGASVMTDTLKLQAYLTDKRLRFNILGEMSVPPGAHLYSFDRMNGVLEISCSGNSGIFDLKEAPHSVTLFLTDSLLHPLAECSAAPRYKPYDFLELDSSMAPGQKLNFATTLPGSDDDVRTVMARIMPASDFITPGIEESVLYAPDLSSALPFPTRLPESDPSVAAADFRGWISTARFNRFSLADVINNPDSIYALRPESRMTIDGVALHNAITGTTFASGYMVAYNNRLRRTYDAPIDSKGRFSIPVDDFEDETDFFLQAVNESNLPEKATLDLMDYAYPPVAPGLTTRFSTGTTKSAVISASDDKAWNIQLRDVVVTARRPRTEHPRIDSKKYFGVKYMDRETIEKRHYVNLYQILFSLPSVNVYKPLEGEQEDGDERKGMKSKKDDNPYMHKVNWIIENRRGSDTFDGKVEFKVLVDGITYLKEMYDVLLEMPAHDIECVEVFSPGEGTSKVAFGFGGVLEITTRGLGKLKPRPSKGTIHELPGLARSADFAEANTLTAPHTPGSYRLVVDIIDGHGIRTLARPFEVK